MESGRDQRREEFASHLRYTIVDGQLGDLKMARGAAPL
jgi:hypothetical protein